jgi:hypothetical protein
LGCVEEEVVVLVVGRRRRRRRRRGFTVFALKNAAHFN